MNLRDIVQDSFLAEINALKPGNVSRYANGHGMCFEDFVSSAKLCSPVLCERELAVGERILLAVERTREAVGCNTNLGMLLLYVPVIKAFETSNNRNYLRVDISKVLQDLTATDTALVFRAIQIASPGGLGKADQHDVRNPPNIKLLQAMELAAGFDLVARQYVTDYATIFEHALPCFDQFVLRWNSVEWATVACYLSIMAGYPDSHIWRKSGEEVARRVQDRAESVFGQYITYNNPAKSINVLLEFDRELKDANLNPGTSADLTATCLLVHGLKAVSDTGKVE